MHYYKIIRTYNTEADVCNRIKKAVACPTGDIIPTRVHFGYW